MSETNELTDPRLQIEEIRGRIYSMGANDSEMSEINNIVHDFETNKISAEEAVKKSNEILERKQDYH
ncbi:MAG TPA: hypothetical protein DEA87_01010 [Candidatus Veblenbacteria bacterium]|uniref:Antitoxin VbhA domain-containing protein n=2 Tax=Candidatus Vebleniibacteriota TaxID=1817921 RepID=A0A1G2Q4F7_9BACT|nr:MAG: hypothetical protein A2226_02685 [Candidatus Veblenbacteria bacterium RIFOXYA2_FULL_43_9]OHA57355.1 MAG: hypothetical protein A2441_00920 [Candidatus Veblenbacteria bacterium RIFOXYC2_FULL_42_11]HAO81442.1 hypothetical protein [Candidatus Veblenbacteria bacterium]HBT92047.1 hypothetical protein [Candidatus Veblenbacteria bacterium]